MLARAARSAVARRGFHTTRVQQSSPYHYPEGPYSNLPFNTKTRFFAVRYWTFMAVGFGAPFGIAGASFLSPVGRAWRRGADDFGKYSLADVPPSLVSGSQRWWSNGDRGVGVYMGKRGKRGTGLCICYDANRSVDRRSRITTRPDVSFLIQPVLTLVCA